MERLEVSGAVRPLYGSLGVRGLKNNCPLTYVKTEGSSRESLRKVYGFRRNQGPDVVAHLLFGPSTNCSRFLLFHVTTARDYCVEKAPVYHFIRSSVARKEVWFVVKQKMNREFFFTFA